MNFTSAQKEQLRQAFAVRGTVPGGLTNIIGLDEVRARHPAMWKRNREKIVSTTRAIIKQYTDPSTDIVIPMGDGNFLLLFTRLEHQDAMVRTGAIKAEVLRRFMGDEALEKLDIQVQTMELNSGAVLGTSLGEILASALHVGDASVPANDPTSADESPGKANADPDLAAGSASLELAPLVKRFEFSFDSVGSAFQPFMHVSRGVFSVFACRPVRNGALGEALTGYGVLPREAGPADFATLDRMVLTSAANGLADMAVRGRIGIVVAPVSFETMTDRSASAEYIGMLQQIPSDLRNCLVPILCRFPVGVPEGRLTEIAGTLKRLSRAVCFRVDSGWQSLASVKAAGAFAVGFNLHEAQTNFAAPGSLERYIASARKVGLSTFVDGIETPQIEQRCRDAKVDFLGGRRLAKLSNHVGPVSDSQVA